jgi:AraC-like DNA-binding protein
LTDPTLTEYREVFQKAFSGETVYSPLKPPIQDLVDRGVTEEKPFESADMDVYFYPIWNVNELAYVVCVFIVKNIYQGRAEMMKARQYIDENWLEEYDADKIAMAANLSATHFNRLFKDHIGVSPYDYYKKIKIENIQKKLLDPNLNITQAFAACGADNTGTFFRAFKELVGKTPSEYREENRKK